MGEAIITSLNTDRFSLDQRPGQFLTGLYDDTVKGGAGYAHAHGTGLLLQALQVFEANGFQFLKAEAYFPEVFQGYTGWFKICEVG